MKDRMFVTKRDKKSFLVGIIPLVVLFVVANTILIFNSVCFHDALIWCLTTFLSLFGIVLIYKQILPKWINTIVAILIGLLTVGIVEISDDLIFRVVMDVCLGLYLLYWIYFGKHLKFYTERENTPLKWFSFFLYVTIPLSILSNGATLMTNIIAYIDKYNVHILDILFPAVFISLGIVVMIGLTKFKTFAFYALYAYWLLPIIYYGMCLLLYMEYGIEPDQKTFADFFASVVMFLLNAIYFWKRRYLFITYNPGQDIIIEYSDKKKIKSHRVKISKSNNKSSLEELKLLKDLLDGGAITLEEYNEKKECILKRVN